MTLTPAPLRTALLPAHYRKHPRWGEHARGAMNRRAGERSVF